MLLNCAQLVVLIVSRLYWSSSDCRSQNWVGLRQFNAFVDWIFIAEPRFFKKPFRPATCVAENCRFGKVKVVARIHAVCCHEWRLNVAVSYCRSVFLEGIGYGKLYPIVPTFLKQSPASSNPMESELPIVQQEHYAADWWDSKTGSTRVSSPRSFTEPSARTDSRSTDQQ